MRNEKVINITESELRDVLENSVNELLTHSEAEHSEEQVTETKPEDSHESDDQAPVEKPSANSSDRNITTGFIAAVRADGEGFRIRDQWYKITGSTRIETDLAKGNKVKVYFSEGEHCVFANAIYDSAPRESAVAEV